MIKIPDQEKYKLIARTCSMSALRKTSRALTQLFDDLLRPMGLHSTQFTLLVALVVAGEATVTPLARELGMDRTTLTRNLEPLQRQGLIEVVHGKDLRTRLIRLTPDGRDIVAQAIPIWEQGQQIVIEHLGQERWTAFMGDLSSLVAMASTYQES